MVLRPICLPWLLQPLPRGEGVGLAAQNWAACLGTRERVLPGVTRHLGRKQMGRGISQVRRGLEWSGLVPPCVGC